MMRLIPKDTSFTVIPKESDLFNACMLEMQVVRD